MIGARSHITEPGEATTSRLEALRLLGTTSHGDLTSDLGTPVIFGGQECCDCREVEIPFHPFCL